MTWPLRAKYSYMFRTVQNDSPEIHVFFSTPHSFVFDFCFSENGYLYDGNI